MSRMHDYEPWWKSAAAGIAVVLFMTAVMVLANTVGRSVVQSQEAQHDQAR